MQHARARCVVLLASQPESVSTRSSGREFCIRKCRADQCRFLGSFGLTAPALRSLSTSGRLLEPQGTFADQSSAALDSREALLATLNKIKRTTDTQKEGPGAAFTAPEPVNNEASSSSTSGPVETPSTTSAAPPATPAASSETVPSESTTDKFTNLKHRINGDVYKALTQRPFNFEKMSSVQEAVLNLLPELAKIPEPTQEGDEAQVDLRQDLLVKAKTGTGKTVAFLVPALEARFNDIEQERQRFIAENPR